jgi:ribosome biogenesis GTPase A
MSTNIDFLIKKIKKNKFKNPKISYTSFLIKKSHKYCLKKIQEESVPCKGDGLGRVRVLVIGIPNVGKSTIINRLRVIGKGNPDARGDPRKAVPTGAHPGVTLAVSSLVRICCEPRKIFVYDTPGVLMPRIDSAQTGLLLALTGAVMDRVVGYDLLVDFLLKTLNEEALKNDGVSETNEKCIQSVPEYVKYFGLKDKVEDSRVLVEQVALNLFKGVSKDGKINRTNAMVNILTAFRAGFLGKFTLDHLK